MAIQTNTTTENIFEVQKSRQLLYPPMQLHYSLLGMPFKQKCAAQQMKEVNIELESASTIQRLKFSI